MDDEMKTIVDIFFTIFYGALIGLTIGIIDTFFKTSSMLPW